LSQVAVVVQVELLQQESAAAEAAVGLELPQDFR
jgi:hypothetical protein